MADWRPVAQWEDQYEVSRYGEVRKKSGELIGQFLNDQGYVCVRLSRPRKMMRVHRLVAIAFIPNQTELPNINHIDFDRTNNRVENLEWCTQKGNLQHSANHGRMQRDYWIGKRSPSSKLTDEQVKEIRARRAISNAPFRILASAFSVSKRTIGRLLRGENYGRVR